MSLAMEAGLHQKDYINKVYFHPPFQRGPSPEGLQKIRHTFILQFMEADL
jgi:hypothetical protein